jgi:hypothetical protein
MDFDDQMAVHLPLEAILGSTIIDVGFIIFEPQICAITPLRTWFWDYMTKERLSTPVLGQDFDFIQLKRLILL